MKKIILIGNGGHSKVIQSMIARTDGYVLKGILDSTINEYYEGDDVFYDSTDHITKYKDDNYFVIAIGENTTRQNIIEQNGLKDENFTSIIDDHAIVSTDVNIGVGTVVMPGVVINPGTDIGKHTIINTRAVVEHDNEVGDFVHVSPNATLAGTVTVKDLAHIGAGATVIPNTTVNQNTIVGAGAVVTSDLEENVLAVGVPAKIIKRR